MVLITGFMGKVYMCAYIYVCSSHLSTIFLLLQSLYYILGDGSGKLAVSVYYCSSGPQSISVFKRSSLCVSELFC